MFEDNSLQLVQILEVNRFSENISSQQDTVKSVINESVNKSFNSSEEDDFL